MGMTEKQGGSDVRANTTRAEPIGADQYRLTGHKWFFSAPMCDLFLVLAQAPGGLTCFLMPRHEPDRQPNGLRLQRLKDKVGNRSNASSEVEFDNAFAWRIGEEGRGVRTIIDMVQLTRLDCALASAGIMRMALAVAIHHAQHRTAFQRKLIDQPVMSALLADLALEQEANTALAISLAAKFDKADGDPMASAQARLMTPVAKFQICKAAPGFVYEALECLGGNGYVEEGLAGRLFRESPLNAIWEGSGNVIALDVLRAIGRSREAADSVITSLEAGTDVLPGGRQALATLRDLLTKGGSEQAARRIVDLIARLAAAAALADCAPAGIAEAYAETRLARTRAVFGANDISAVTNLLLERAWAT
jgi:putative acyl-CoA dehydrogenase